MGTKNDVITKFVCFVIFSHFNRLLKVKSQIKSTIKMLEEGHLNSGEGHLSL